MNPQDFGIYCEDLAATWLIKKGFNILDRNFKSKFGEIDIVAIKENFYCWVEVKGRRYANKSCKLDYPPVLAVNKSKLEKILKTSKFYCLANNLYDIEQRVLVIEVYCYNSGEIEINPIDV